MPEQPEPDPETAAGCQGANCEQVSAILHQAEKSAEHAAHEDHRRREQRNWRIQNIINGAGSFVTFIAMCAAVGGGYIALLALNASWEAVTASRNAANEAHEQTVQARRQADIAAAETFSQLRPWLSPLISINKLDIKAIGASVDFVLTVKNDGHAAIFTPYTNANVVMGTESYLLRVGFLLNDYCSETQRMRWIAGRSGGSTLPPSEAWPQPRTVDILETKPWAIVVPPGHTRFFIYGCVYYDLMGSVRNIEPAESSKKPMSEHFTSFIYELGLPDPRNDIDIIDIDVSRPQNIDAGGLRLRREFAGTRAE
jgi:hypothetical protein